MTTTRARLQELGLDALRDMAGSIDVDHDGLQKTKLITAIVGSDKFDVKMLPEPPPEEAVASVKTDEAPAETSSDSEPRQNGDGRSRQGGRDNQGDRDNRGQDGNRNRRRRNKRGRPQDRSMNPSSRYAPGSSTFSPKAMGSCVVLATCHLTKTFTCLRIRFVSTSCARVTSAKARFVRPAPRRNSRLW